MMELRNQNGETIYQMPADDWHDFLNAAVESGVDFAGAQFEQANIIGHDFSGQNLAGARFLASHVRQCQFRGANLSGAHFTFSVLNIADFSGADLTQTTIMGSSFLQCRWKNADISLMKNSGATFHGDGLIDGGVDSEMDSWIGIYDEKVSKVPLSINIGGSRTRPIHELVDTIVANGDSNDPDVREQIIKLLGILTTTEVRQWCSPVDVSPLCEKLLAFNYPTTES